MVEWARVLASAQDVHALPVATRARTVGSALGTAGRRVAPVARHLEVVQRSVASANQRTTIDRSEPRVHHLEIAHQLQTTALLDRRSDVGRAHPKEQPRRHQNRRKDDPIRSSHETSWVKTQNQ